MLLGTGDSLGRGTRKFSGVMDMLSLDRGVGYTRAYFYQIDLNVNVRLSISLTVKDIFVFLNVKTNKIHLLWAVFSIFSRLHQGFILNWKLSEADPE